MDWLFWDNDGVLVLTEHLYYQACAEALQRADLVLELADFQDISLHRGQSVFDWGLARGLPAAAIPTLKGWRDRCYAELLADAVVVAPGIQETLEKLAGRLGMAIVTSCRREHFVLMHRTTGLLDYFDFVLVREDYDKSKPHPEPYLRALERSGCQAGRGLAIEDSPRGVLAASRAGLDCIAIPGALNRGGDFQAARWQLASAGEIPNLLGMG